MRASQIAWTLVLMVAASAGAVPAAGAEPSAGAPAPERSADADRRAAEHYQAGIRALEAGRDSEAYAQLLEAWKLKRHFQIAANLGDAELRLGGYREAAGHLEYFLREAEGVRPEEMERAREMLREAKARIEAEEREAREARAAHEAVAAAKVAEAATAAPGGGGEAPAPKPAPMPAAAAPLRWPAVAAAGVAVAGVGVGVGFTIAADAKSAEAREALEGAIRKTPKTTTVCPENQTPSPSCNKLAELLKDKDRLTDVAVVGYVVGGAAALGAVALTIWPIRRGEAGFKGGVAPMVTLHGGGFTVKGNF